MLVLNITRGIGRSRTLTRLIYTLSHTFTTARIPTILGRPNHIYQFVWKQSAAHCRHHWLFSHYDPNCSFYRRIQKRFTTEIHRSGREPAKKYPWGGSQNSIHWSNTPIPANSDPNDNINYLHVKRKSTHFSITANPRLWRQLEIKGPEHRRSQSLSVHKPSLLLSSLQWDTVHFVSDISSFHTPAITNKATRLTSQAHGTTPLPHPKTHSILYSTKSKQCQAIITHAAYGESSDQILTSSAIYVSLCASITWASKKKAKVALNTSEA